MTIKGEFITLVFHFWLFIDLEYNGNLIFPISPDFLYCGGHLSPDAEIEVELEVEVEGNNNTYTSLSTIIDDDSYFLSPW